MHRVIYGIFLLFLGEFMVEHVHPLSWLGYILALIGAVLGCWDAVRAAVGAVLRWVRETKDKDEV